MIQKKKIWWIKGLILKINLVELEIWEIWEDNFLVMKRNLEIWKRSFHNSLENQELIEVGLAQPFKIQMDRKNLTLLKIFLVLKILVRLKI